MFRVNKVTDFSSDEIFRSSMLSLQSVIHTYTNNYEWERLYRPLNLKSEEFKSLGFYPRTFSFMTNQVGHE